MCGSGAAAPRDEMGLGELWRADSGAAYAGKAATAARRGRTRLCTAEPARVASGRVCVGVCGGGMQAPRRNAGAQGLAVGQAGGGGGGAPLHVAAALAAARGLLQDARLLGPQVATAPRRIRSPSRLTHPRARARAYSCP